MAQCFDGRQSFTNPALCQLAIQYSPKGRLILTTGTPGAKHSKVAFNSDHNEL